MLLNVLIITFTVISVTGLKHGVDLNKSLVRCENGSEWLPVNVNSIANEILEWNSTYNTLEASSYSCASMDIIFETGFLEFSVNVHAVSTSIDSGFRIIVDNETGIQMVYDYRKSSKEFVIGWNSFLIPVQKGICHITVLGFCRSDDIVLLEAIRYINKTFNKNETVVDLKTIIKTNDDQSELHNLNDISKLKTSVKEVDLTEFAQRRFIDNDNTENVYIQNSSLVGNYVLDGNGNQDEVVGSNDNHDDEEYQSSFDSKDSEVIQGNSDNQIGKENTNRNEGDSANASFWNPWTITLVAIGSATVVAILCIGSYYIGKMRGSKQVIDEVIIEEDVEAPRVIPRIKHIYDSPTRFMSSFSNQSQNIDS